MTKQKMSRRNIRWLLDVRVSLILALACLCLPRPVLGQEARPARIVTAKVMLADCAQRQLIPTQVSRQGASHDMPEYQERDELAPEPMSRKLAQTQCESSKLTQNTRF